MTLSNHNHNLEATPPNTVLLGVGVRTREVWGGNHVGHESGFKGSGLAPTLPLSELQAVRPLFCFANTSDLPCPEMLCGYCLEHSAFGP